MAPSSNSTIHDMYGLHLLSIRRFPCFVFGNIFHLFRSQIIEHHKIFSSSTPSLLHRFIFKIFSSIPINTDDRNFGTPAPWQNFTHRHSETFRKVFGSKINEMFSKTMKIASISICFSILFFKFNFLKNWKQVPVLDLPSSGVPALEPAYRERRHRKNKTSWFKKI